MQSNLQRHRFERPDSRGHFPQLLGVQQMHLLDLPQFNRFRDRRDVKALRHKDKRLDLWALRASDRAIAIQGRGAYESETIVLQSFEEYQNRQGWDVFGDARFIISFFAERHKFARFVGVWEVLG